jgi:hypothetical protein
MRKTVLAAALAALVIAGASPARGAGVGVDGGGGQVAAADWTVFTSKTHGI